MKINENQKQKNVNEQEKSGKVVTKYDLKKQKKAEKTQEKQQRK